MNLATNASEALGETPGTIKIRSLSAHYDQAMIDGVNIDSGAIAGEYVGIEVSDDGIGMSEETVDRIFDPFFSTKFTGRGLGLATVLGTARTHNGIIQVNSVLGQGTTIRVMFPFKAIESESELARSAEENVVNAQNGTILIADDESYILRLSSKVLSRYGYEVITAKNGREGG